MDQIDLKKSLFNSVWLQIDSVVVGLYIVSTACVFDVFAN